MAGRIDDTADEYRVIDVHSCGFLPVCLVQAFLPVCSRGLSYLLAEFTDEAGGIVIAQGAAYILDTVGGVDQHILGHPHFVSRNKGGWGNMQLSLKGVGQLRRRHVEMLCHVVQGKIRGFTVFIDILDDRK